LRFSFELCASPKALSMAFSNFYRSTFLSSIPRNQNSIAQTQNSMRDFSDQALVLLVNAITADDIPGFPANPSALNHASAATINHLFEALGLRGFGIWVEKRRRIAAAIGLKD